MRLLLKTNESINQSTSDWSHVNRVDFNAQQLGLSETLDIVDKKIQYDILWKKHSFHSVKSVKSDVRESHLTSPTIS